MVLKLCLDAQDKGYLESHGATGTIAIGGNELWIWRLSDLGTPIAKYPSQGSIQALAFDDSGEKLVSASMDRCVRLYSLGKENRSPVTLGKHESYVKDIAIDGAGSLVVSGGNDRIRVWKLTESGASQIDLAQPDGIRRDRIYSVAISRDGRFIAGGGYHRLVFVWQSDATEKSPRELRGTRAAHLSPAVSRG